ncbi:MAG: phosphopyruvate hydratase [Nitrososphaerota archaeon]|nr:phosphopyruvate hydratase [Nitrososphaerota archaeon]
MTEKVDVISNVVAREILDSRGRPTIEVDVYTYGGNFGRAMVPSGASKGEHEALELRDKDILRYRGLGVRNAVRNITEIIGPKIIGLSAFDQEEIDRTMIEIDGTQQKQRLGANAILGVSLATVKASAAQKKIGLYHRFHELVGSGSGNLIPLPLVNVLSGGLHARKGFDFQDFQIVPLKRSLFSDTLPEISEIINCTSDLLIKQGNPSLGFADEGGYCPIGLSNREACELLISAIENAGHVPGKDVGIAIDFASNSFFRNNGYVLHSEDRVFDRSEMIDYIIHFCSNYPIVSIEDPLVEIDWDGWREITKSIGKRVQIIGDDIFVTNLRKIEIGVNKEIGNAVLIKMNQIGTVTETLDAMLYAKRNAYRTIVSARSGETEDSSIADLAVGTNAGQIKVGSLHDSSRLAKWNQLLRIEEELTFSGLTITDWESLMN